jgi:hypothetical protein
VPIPRRTMRQLIIEFLGSKCTICSAIDRLHVDHIIPLSEGGVDRLDNLQLLCIPCHKKKHGAQPVEEINLGATMKNTGDFIHLRHDSLIKELAQFKEMWLLLNNEIKRLHED